MREKKDKNKSIMDSFYAVIVSLHHKWKGTWLLSLYNKWTKASPQLATRNENFDICVKILQQIISKTCHKKNNYIA